MWDNTYDVHLSPNTSHNSPASQPDTMLTDNPDYNPQESLKSSQDLEKSVSYKLQRRLAQNREAARKSRLKKKAYVQELESGRLKLAKLEHEIEMTRKQATYMDLSNNVNGLLPGIVAFEKNYDQWVIEQQNKESELATILQTDVTDMELRVFVDDIVNHYQVLFQMKAEAAKTDTFNLLHGSWKSPIERLFQWLGGFRPSEILYMLMPRFEPLTDTQVVSLSRLRHTCRQAEDALTQGLDKLEQTLAQSVAINVIEGGKYDTLMNSMIEVLESLENFLNQADHLRHRTLQQMSRILTVRQASRGLLALGEYFQRLRVLNSLWASRPRAVSS
ncbi:transcription factor TGA7-like [Bidens hawaiensis]|uniref:transcription factor TGA7-like n=1 Tax=Bidens hawaiensis TaxID=980011 RepID=UPI004048F9E4